MKSFFLVLNMLFFSHILFANALPLKQTISGVVVDFETKAPLMYATVSIHKNGELVDGIITDEEGKFFLNAETGSYFLRVDYISYKSYEIEIDLIKKLDLGEIPLEADVEALNEVEVVGEKSSVELKLDKKVFNVGKDILSKSGSLSQVLDNVPSVAVDVDGAVSLRGNGNVTILINGKPSALTANQGLDQILAVNIDRVEVITNPSSRYQAAGTAGIINVILKKNTKGGLSGSISLTTGIPDNHRISSTLNYKTDKINLFSTLGYNNANYKGKQTVEQSSFTENTPIMLKQQVIENRNDREPSIYIGLDYLLNDKNTITASYYKSIIYNRDKTNYMYDYFNNMNNLDSTLIRNEDYYEPQDWNQLEVNYIKTFKTEGKKLTLDFQHDFWDDDENETLTTQKTFPMVEESQYLKTHNVESSTDYLLQLDFVTPLGKKGSFETGIRLETRVITSDYLVENLFNNVWQQDENLTNEVDYNEKIGGAYFQFSSKLNKLNYQLGLRTELTNIEVLDDENTFKNTKEYIKLFPTAHLSYSFSETTNAQLSYSKRINRPRFWQLNPFAGLSDLNAIRIGNPDLDPAFTNSFELGLLKQWPKVRVNPSIYYHHTIGFFNLYINQNEEGLFITQPINLDYENRIGIEVSITYNPFKWMKWSGELNYYNFEQSGVFKQQNFDFNSNTWFTRLNTNIQLPSEITLQTTFNYKGKNQTAQTFTKSQSYLDFGLSKNILDKKAAITLNARNILDSRKQQWTTTGENFTYTSNRKAFGARYSLSFTYRFNQRTSERRRAPGGSNRQ